LKFALKHKAELSTYAPRIETMQIKPSKIGIVIGPAANKSVRLSKRQALKSTSMIQDLSAFHRTNNASMQRAKQIVHTPDS